MIICYVVKFYTEIVGIHVTGKFHNVIDKRKPSE